VFNSLPAHFLVPISCRKQLNDLPDDMVTKIAIQYYTDLRDALDKALVD
jgi:ATP-dependent Lon protease